MMAEKPWASYELELGFRINWFCPSCGRRNHEFIPMNEANHEKTLMCWNCFQEVIVNADESEPGCERGDEGCAETRESKATAFAEKGD